MMSTNRGFSLSFTVLVALVALALVGCGGDEPAPAPPPPAPPPAPPFVPQDVVIDLGSSGEKLTLQTTEAGGFTRNGEAFSSGTAVEAAGNSYRLTLESGTWSAAYEAPNPWAVSLGRSGEALLITRREDGLFEGDGSVFESGGIVSAANGNQYRLTLADGRWTSAFLPPEPVPVGLGASGEVVLVARTEGGSYQVGGQAVVSGSVVRSSTGAAYRLAMQDGAWTAAFEPPPPVAVSLGASGQTVRLQLGEDGSYRRDGQPFASGTTVEAGGESFLLTLQNGRWTAISQAPVLQTVRLGTSAVTLTLQRTSGGGWSEDGEPVRNGEVRTVGGNRYRLLLDDGEWSAEYLRGTIPVDGAGGLIILFREEDGSLTHDGDRVGDGSVITQDGRTYELLRLSDGTWLATPGAPPPAAGDQTVSLPGSGRSITLTRGSDGSYTYENTAATDGRLISVGGVDYRLNRNAQGVWSAVAITGTGGTINPGTVGGPTQTDEVDTFTESRFGTDDDNPYGVRFRRRGRPAVSSRGTSMIPAEIHGDVAQYQGSISQDDWDNGERPADMPDFPVYGLVGRGLVSQERSYAETAKAKLEEIISVIQLNKPLYAAEDVDPDDHIGSDGDNGLWDDAETAIARIFGVTKAGNPLGGNPAGSRVDVDEVDDIIATLQDAISALSDVEAFEQEFEDAIADKNTTTTDFDAGDFFTGVMSKIRFGSTNGTRFGVYAYRKKHTGGDPAVALQHAAQSGTDIEWDTGVIAYTPLDGPSSGDIPSRGQARFQGDTVAIDDTSNAGSPVLYAGKIELIASFAKGEVNGTVTALKDEGGDAWEFESSLSFRDEVVKSITLPKATRQEAAQIGFYEATVAAGTNEATLAFDRNLRDEPGRPDDTLFEVQLLDEATEALGVWEAFGLEGSFGATRSGTVTTPTLPSFTDRGDGVDSLVVYIGATHTPVGAITTNEEDNTFTLTRTNLGEPPGDLGANDDTDQLSYTLTSLYGTSTRTVRGQTFAANARTLISRWRAELAKRNVGLTADEDNNIVEIDSSFRREAEEALTQLGITTPPAWASDWDGDDDTDEADWLRALSDASAALGSRSRFQSEQESDGVFSSLTYTNEQIDTLLATRNLDFTLRMDRTRYTRFGVWSQKAPDIATDSLTSNGDTIDTGTLAYSFLKQEGGIGLTFIADYRGTTVAVDEDNGNLYRGTIDLTVNWADSGNGGGSLSSSITDLRGVSGTSAYLQHEDKDVRTIFFSPFNFAAGGSFSASDGATIDIGYRNGQQDRAISSAGNLEGVFVGDSHNEGPLGVLGRWRIAEIGFQGSFGADLQP